MDIPYGNRTALHSEIQHGWISPPSIRGTASIVYTCLITITLCVYSSLHLNIPAPGERPLRQYLRKAKWVVIGIFAPEIVLCTAYMQYCEAKTLYKKLNKTWLDHTKDVGEEGRTSTTNSDTQKAANAATLMLEPTSSRSGGVGSTSTEPFDLTYAFYVGMGGFRTDISQFDERFKTVALNGKKIAALAEQGHFFHIDPSTIADKSKADILAKSLVIIQVSWMVVQCIARKAAGLPLTLIELHTFTHAICAGAIYGLWFKKPLGVSEATPVALPEHLHASIFPGNFDGAGFVYFSHCDKVQERKAGEGYLTDSTFPIHNSRIHAIKQNCTEVEKDSLSSRVHVIRRAPEMSNFWINTRCAVCSAGLSVDELYLAKRLRTQQIESLWNYHNQTKVLTHRIPSVGDEDDVRAEPDGFRSMIQYIDLDFFVTSAALLIQAVYGGLHLSAWNYRFPSLLELWFWRASCICIATWLPVFAVMIWSINFFLEIFLDEDIINRSAYPIVMGCLALLLIMFARVFVVAEAFISLRAVPIGVYAVLPWTNYIPHL